MTLSVEDEKNGIIRIKTHTEHGEGMVSAVHNISEAGKNEVHIQSLHYPIVLQSRADINKLAKHLKRLMDLYDISSR